MKLLLQIIWSLWLGSGLAILGYNFMDWQFYTYLVPAIILILIWDNYE